LTEKTGRTSIMFRHFGLILTKLEKPTSH